MPESCKTCVMTPHNITARASVLKVQLCPQKASPTFLAVIRESIDEFS